MQYQLVRADKEMEGWLEYERILNDKVMVFIPATWGNKRAAMHFMRAGLAGLMMPKGEYKIVVGRDTEIAAFVNEINQTPCMLLGRLSWENGDLLQATIRVEDKETQARETWGKLVAGIATKGEE